MKIIFIRGLPGTGKTTISKLLKEKLSAEIIYVDNFKLEAISEGASVKDSRKIAYIKTLQILESYIKKNPKYLILEEIISDLSFFNQLQNFIKNNNLTAYWFRIERPLEELLRVESDRKRKVKNTKKDLTELNKKIGDIKIEKEVIAQNDDINKTVGEVIKHVLT